VIKIILASRDEFHKNLFFLFGEEKKTKKAIAVGPAEVQELKT
jgi:hypothetical protein